jgi:hypothetical protein
MDVTDRRDVVEVVLIDEYTAQQQQTIDRYLTSAWALSRSTVSTFHFHSRSSGPTMFMGQSTCAAPSPLPMILEDSLMTPAVTELVHIHYGLLYA